MTVGLLAFVAMAGLAQTQAPNQSAENQAALLKQLSAEVQQLRLEVIQQAIEFQHWKIQRLERELQPIQSERQRLGEQEQAINQLIAELEQHIGNALPAQEGTTGELEAMKAASTEKGLKELSSKQQLVVQRETELTEQLAQEQQRLQELERKAKKLRAEG
jgi:chromosome segregation ATPase